MIELPTEQLKAALETLAEYKTLESIPSMGEQIAHLIKAFVSKHKQTKGPVYIDITTWF